LTDAGANLHSIAREYFAALSDFKLGCKDQPIEVVIGAGDSVIQWLLLPRLGEIRRGLPGIRFKFLNLSTIEAVKRLSDGSLDFAIVRTDAVGKPFLSVPIGIMSYSLFVPRPLKSAPEKTSNNRLLDHLPLATLEGEGSFRSALQEFGKKQKTNLNIQIECSSFPLAARAVKNGDVAAILPEIASIELQNMAAVEMKLGFLRKFDRKMSLVSNPRSLRIRPALQQVQRTLAELCHFERSAVKKVDF
jgi:DNA-binding transcriptional LysR family regulator